MNLEFLILGEYGIFVWSAFIFTFISCFFLYLKTKKEFQRQEKFFLSDHKHIQDEKIENSKKKEALSGSPIF